VSGFNTGRSSSDQTGQRPDPRQIQQISDGFHFPRLADQLFLGSPPPDCSAVPEARALSTIYPFAPDSSGRHMRNPQNSLARPSALLMSFDKRTPNGLVTLVTVRAPIRSIVAFERTLLGCASDLLRE
jgi:hypothetical protein